MTFSASDAAFEGFRLVRRKPSVILWWSLVYLVFFAAILLLAGGPILALMPQVAAMEQSGEPTPEMLGTLFGLYAAVIAIALPLGVVFSAVLSTAVARGVLEPTEGRLGYLRLGRDEFRVGVVVLVLTLLLFAAYMAAGLLFGLFVALGAAINPVMAVVFGLLGAALAICGLVWIVVRMSLAVPITFAEKRIAIFDSFGMTKGRFWPLLGMAVIALMMTLLVALLGMIVVLPLQFLGLATFDAAVQSGEMERVMAALGPAVAVGALLNLILATLQLAVMYAPFSVAYRDIKRA